MDVTISQLTKVYGGKVRALDGIDLRIQSGMFGLLGPNGAGKTTLMRILAGILHPTSGTVRIGGQECRTERERTALKRVLGYLPQELGVYPDLTAFQFLDYIGILKGMDDGKARTQRVAELLEIVGLSEVARRRLKMFSGGMKRRVGIAQALLNDPRLLIVDEPTAGLDPEERIRFRNLLSELAGDRTVLLSTHIVEDIAQTCQRLAVMTAGKASARQSLDRNDERRQARRRFHGGVYAPHGQRRAISRGGRAVATPAANAGGAQPGGRLRLADARAARAGRHGGGIEASRGDHPETTDKEQRRETTRYPGARRGELGSAGARHSGAGHRLRQPRESQRAGLWRDDAAVHSRRPPGFCGLVRRPDADGALLYSLAGSAGSLALNEPAM